MWAVSALSQCLFILFIWLNHHILGSNIISNNTGDSYVNSSNGESVNVNGEQVGTFGTGTVCLQVFLGGRRTTHLTCVLAAEGDLCVAGE